MQAKGASTWPATPGAPTIGTATAGTAACASVTFTAPACTGYPAGGITGYRVISTPGCFSNTGASSPVVVSGLTVGTSYTFKAQATNATGYGALSAASNSITASSAGSQSYTCVGSFSWVAPAGVTSVSAVVIGGGGYRAGTGISGGGGGALAYRNNVTVIPGNSYTVVVGDVNNSSALGTPINITGGAGLAKAYNVCCGYYPQGTGGNPAGCYTGGGSGGAGGGCNTAGGGGGAGGYSGSGGAGAVNSTLRNGEAGLGGGGGGGGGPANQSNKGGGGGGGVGLFGEGSSGARGVGSGCTATGGAGGSGGTAGGTYTSGNVPGGAGGNYGGGGGSNKGYGLGMAGTGAVRIMWPGNTRSFPSTCAGAP